MFKNPDTNLVNIGQLLAVSRAENQEQEENLCFQVIERTGIRRTDHRLTEMVTKLKKFHKDRGADYTTVDNLDVDLSIFKEQVFSSL